MSFLDFSIEKKTPKTFLRGIELASEFWQCDLTARQELVGYHPAIKARRQTFATHTHNLTVYVVLLLFDKSRYHGGIFPSLGL